jgi:hypothetical protein
MGMMQAMVSGAIFATLWMNLCRENPIPKKTEISGERARERERERERGVPMTLTLSSWIYAWNSHSFLLFFYSLD